MKLESNRKILVAGMGTSPAVLTNLSPNFPNFFVQAAGIMV